MVNIYIALEMNLWPFTIDKDFALANSFFEAAKLTKNADFDKYKYSGYGIGFYASGSSSLSDSSGFGKIVICGAEMNSSVHTDNKRKDILILGKCPIFNKEI